MNLSLLLTEIQKPEFAGKTAAQVAAILNAPTLTKWREVPKPDIENYVRNTNISLKLTDFLTTTDSLVANQMLNLALPENAAKKALYNAAKEVKALFSGSIPFINGQNVNIQLTIGGFVQAGIFSQAEAAAFFAQFQYQQSRAQELLREAVTESDIQATRNIDDIAEVQGLLERAGSAYGEVLALLQGAKVALEEGQSLERPSLQDAIARFVQTMETP